MTARRYTIDVPPEWLRKPRRSRRDAPETTSRPLTATVADQAIAKQMERANQHDNPVDSES